ncbi:hypothetical protein R1sor_012691 [Riccia sorocarpa]|uniref:Uncharacterized protein n=1 Tax=Riccia sorocarpa TaxID=122646 RepID=A0ABD3I894_9MARC
MSGAGGKADNDKTVAQAAGAVVASGVLWSLYKSIRGRGTTSAQEQSTQAKPSGSRPKADLSYQVERLLSFPTEGFHSRKQRDAPLYWSSPFAPPVVKYVVILVVLSLC